MQTLQYVRRPADVLRNVWRALAPGGSLLLSAPSISRVDLMCGPTGDRWRFTESGVNTLFVEHLDVAPSAIKSFGSLATAGGFLAGVPAERLVRGALDWHDPLFPIVVCARVDKPS